MVANGNLFVGTGSKGRIYLIAPDRSQTLLVQSPEDQTSSLIAVGETLYAASSNLGRWEQGRKLLETVGNQPGAI